MSEEKYSVNSTAGNHSGATRVLSPISPLISRLKKSAENTLAAQIKNKEALFQLQKKELRDMIYTSFISFIVDKNTNVLKNDFSSSPQGRTDNEKRQYTIKIRCHNKDLHILRDVCSEEGLMWSDAYLNSFTPQPGFIDVHLLFDQTGSGIINEIIKRNEGLRESFVDYLCDGFVSSPTKTPHGGYSIDFSVNDIIRFNIFSARKWCQEEGLELVFSGSGDYKIIAPK